MFQTWFCMYSTTKEDSKPSWHGWKIVDWDKKQQHKHYYRISQMFLFIPNFDSTNGLTHLRGWVPDFANSLGQ